jgi:DNA (cytosine-5)-methyltransferase 1
MKYISVCSGIEAATVAWHPLGFRPLFFSEIDTFPSAVLAHHYPEVPNVGDLTRYQEWPNASPDIIVGGTPCQAFSIAGFRQGMADPRGNLALTYLAMVDRYRPLWVVWENVPGVLSSTGGRDFGSFLGALAKLGYGFAYRVLDAQFFGLAQRRRRVFVVAHLGDWRRAAEVLIEPEGLSGNPPPSREARQTAPTIPSRRSAGGGLGTDFDCDGGPIASTGDISHCLNAGGMGRIDYETETLITHTLRADGFDGGEDGTGRGTPLVPSSCSVRRVTPRECERLQGFPDDYTLIPTGKTGKPSKDGPRYKALGNSMAVPVMHWIGKRIANIDHPLPQ